jgi:hypothetical protein
MLTHSQIQEHRFLDILHQCPQLPGQIERPSSEALHTAVFRHRRTRFGNIYEVVRNGYGAPRANLFPLAQGRCPVVIRRQLGSWLDRLWSCTSRICMSDVTGLLHAIKELTFMNSYLLYMKQARTRIMPLVVLFQPSESWTVLFTRLD